MTGFNALFDDEESRGSELQPASLWLECPSAFNLQSSLQGGKTMPSKQSMSERRVICDRTGIGL